MFFGESYKAEKLPCLLACRGKIVIKKNKNMSLNYYISWVANVKNNHYLPKKILAGPTLLNVNVTNAVLVWLYQGLFRI